MVISSDNKKIFPLFACFSAKNTLPSRQVFGRITDTHKQQQNYQ